MSKKKEHMTRTQLGSLAKEALVDCALSFQKDNASLSSRQEKLSGRLKELKADIKTKDALIARQEAEIQDLREQLANAIELKKLRNRDRFVSDSEQMEFLFDESEILNQPQEEEDDGDKAGKHLVKSHERKKRTVHGASKDTPVVDVDHTAGAPEEIVKKGVRMVRDGESVVTKLAYRPAVLVVERHIYPKYRAADTCSEGRNANTAVQFENEVMDKTGASPSLLASVALSKFDDHLPLYRQEEILGRLGVPVSRQCMAGWLGKAYSQLLPLEELIRKRVYASHMLHLDETSITVLNVLGKNGKPSRNGFVYIAQGLDYDAEARTTHALTLCEYHQGRKTGDIMENLLHYERDGHIMTDGLKQYYSYPYPDRHAVCWVHAVRGFKNALKVDRKEPLAKKVCLEAAKLYKIDADCREELKAGAIGPQEFLDKRKALSKPVIDGIIAMAENATGYTKGSQMGKAIAYIVEYERYLHVYLDCLEASPSNNCVERVAKQFATGRKNWLFSQSVDGADASCFFFSLIETAKAQGVDPGKYLEYVFSFGPKCRTDEDWERMLPWNADLSKVDEIRDRLSHAQSDPDRTEPYFFSGAVI